MTTISVFAPAKINLALHVTGQRSDGYHLLDSLVAFAPVGDRLQLEPAETFSMSVIGPEAEGVPADGSNLVMQAAALYAKATGMAGGMRFILDKHLPPASGIGGGSSDAAAALRGLATDPAMLATCGPLARLGADIPMCIRPEPQRARGVGELLETVSLPPLPSLLVNPRVAVATPTVFKALARKDNAPLPDLPRFETTTDCIDWLAAQRNDLQAPAVTAAPVIAEVLDTLAALPGCRLARMSGSGATCFALFATETEACRAAATLRTAHPAWWCAAGTLGDQRAASVPKIGG